MKYIQSFYQYPVTFSSIGKTIPARSAQGDLKNLAEISEAELEKLQNREPFFRELVDKKKIRVLNHMPESYKTSASRINEANDEIARLKAENERLRAQQQAATVSKEETIEPAEEKAQDPGKNLQGVKKKSEKKCCHTFEKKKEFPAQIAQILTQSPKNSIADYIHYVNCWQFLVLSCAVAYQFATGSTRKKGGGGAG